MGRTLYLPIAEKFRLRWLWCSATYGVREAPYRITSERYQDVLDDADNFDAAKYLLQNTSSRLKFSKMETSLSPEYHVNKKVIDSEMIERLRSWSSRNRNRLSSMRFNSNDCLDDTTGMNEEHHSGAIVTKLNCQSSNEGPIPEIVELCKESLENRLINMPLIIFLNRFR